MSFDLYLTREPFTNMRRTHSLWNSVFLSVTPCNKRLFHRETQRKDGATQRKEHLRPDFVGIPWTGFQVLTQSRAA